MLTIQIGSAEIYNNDAELRQRLIAAAKDYADISPRRIQRILILKFIPLRAEGYNWDMMKMRVDGEEEVTISL